MRPLSIELKGFGAFRAETMVDLADTELFALVGATGSGKSTIIDAICFALYGSVFRLDNKGKVGAVVALGEPEARVRLRFEVEGRQYVLVRVVKATGDGLGSTKEVRLERLDDNVVLAATVGELDGAKGEQGAVAQLLRMEFEQFTRCVVLPQGAFAQFLHSRNKERQELLASLIDLSAYERVRDRAMRRVTSADRKLSELTGKLSELAPHDETTMVALSNRLQELDSLSGRTGELVQQAAQALRETASLSERLASLRRDVQALGAIRVPDGLALLDLRRTQAQQTVEAASARIAEAGEAVQRTSAAVAQLPSAPAIDRVLGLLTAIEQADASLAELDAQIATAQQAVQQATVYAAAATDAHRGARSTLEQAQRANQAHALAGGLHVGDACPVCERIIDAPLAIAHQSDLAQLQSDATRADDMDRAAARALADASTKVATLQARATALREVRNDNAATMAPLVVGMPSTRGELAELQAKVGLAVRQEVAARAADQEARSAESTARAELAAALQDLEQARARYQSARDPWAAVGAPVASDDLGRSWAGLIAWAAEHAAALDAEGRRLTEQAEALTRGSVDRFAELHADAVNLGCLMRAEPVTSVDSLAADCAALDRTVGEHRANALARFTEATVAAERANVLEESKAGWEEAKSVASTLARRLDRGANGFPQWLLAASLASLVHRASGTLYELSGNQFSLTLDGQADIVVIDHTCADLRRPVRTLSGGETFQASLALALALADELGGGGDTASKRLPIDALFLDEGFGTLDPENLDKVAATIEALGGTGRVVGIVTHVKELADRMPVRFRVSKTPSGSVVEREVS